MGAPSRRGAIGTILGIGCVAALPFGASVALAQTRVVIPPNPMRLSRQLQRTLRGGAMLTVTRNWRVEFAFQGRGISIAGAQLDAKVDAPPALSALAQIEESRSTASMWPILLSANGRIMAAGNGLEEGDLSAAMEEAERFIAESPLPPSEQDARLHYLSTLNRVGSSMLEQLPEDLFFPRGALQTTKQMMELPGGITGELEVTYDAKCTSGCDWLESATRQITTRIGDTEQHAIEQWSLAEM